MSGDRTIEAVYRKLLRLYPRRFTDDYGDDMVAVLHDQLADGRTPLVAGRTFLDLAVSVPAQHLEAHMRNPTPLVLAGWTLVALAGVVLAVAGGSNRTTLVIGLAMAVVAGPVAAGGRSRLAPPGAAARRVTDDWWKFLVAGGAIAGSVIVGAGVGVEAWYLGLALCLLAALSAFAGVVLGLAALGRGLRSAR